LKPSSPLVKYFLIFVFSLLALSFLFPPKPKVPSSNDPTFTVRSADKLFFKNLRSYYYHSEWDNAGVFNLRRFKKLDSETLQFLLIENEALDEWYIRAYWSDSLTDRLWWIEHQAVALDSLNNEEQWQFAFEFYSAILNNKELKYCNTDNSSDCVYLDEEQRKKYEANLFDYFRIIGLN